MVQTIRPIEIPNWMTTRELRSQLLLKPAYGHPALQYKDRLKRKERKIEGWVAARQTADEDDEDHEKGQEPGGESIPGWSALPARVG